MFTASHQKQRLVIWDSSASRGRRGIKIRERNTAGVQPKPVDRGGSPLHITDRRTRHCSQSVSTPSLPHRSIRPTRVGHRATDPVSDSPPRGTLMRGCTVLVQGNSLERCRNRSYHPLFPMISVNFSFQSYLFNDTHGVFIGNIFTRHTQDAGIEPNSVDHNKWLKKYNAIHNTNTYSRCSRDPKLAVYLDTFDRCRPLYMYGQFALVVYLQKPLSNAVLIFYLISTHL